MRLATRGKAAKAKQLDIDLQALHPFEPTSSFPTSDGVMRRPFKAESLEILKKRGVPIKTIVDVGVQRQTPELIKAFPDKKHVLFEPVTEYKSAIISNYASIDYDLYEVAVSDVTREATLEVRSIVNSQQITHSGLVSDSTSKRPEQLRKVQAVSLDDALSNGNYATPYLLKIDIDGRELDVLRGAKSVLRQTSIVIIEASKSQFVERVAAVQAAGFELFDLAEPVYYDEAFWQCDAFFIRKDLHVSHFIQLATDFRPELYVPFK
jgi:FkbM family methyltransferase